MSRILGIDFGLKRTGIAVTDPLQIIASGLTTVETKDLMEFLIKYLKEEIVEAMVVGESLHKDGNPTYLQEHINQFIIVVKKQFPDLIIVLQDERYSSIEAKKVILQSGIKKMKRQDKSLVDKISAAIILQDYMRSIGKY
jgi:putative holliday junction resolvase